MNPRIVLQVEREIAALRRYFTDGYQSGVKNNGLLVGRSGIILLQSILLDIEENDSLRSDIENNLQTVLDHLENESYLSSYCDGLAGIGWLFLHLTQRDYLDLDLDEFLGPVDLSLRQELNTMCEQKWFDALHGAIGIGLYFLAREKTEPVETLIRAICSGAHQKKKRTRLDRYHHP